EGVPRRCWWRLFAGSVPLNLLLVAVCWWQLGPWALLILLWLPWSAYAAWQHAGRMGYWLDARLLAVRGGWWSRWWRVAEVDKIQGDRKSTRLNSSHVKISYAVFCLKKK